MLDYQTPHSDADQAHHFGPPLGSVEIRLKDMEGYKNGDEQAVGRLVVNGPAVVGGEGVGERVMRVTGTGTLAYV